MELDVSVRNGVIIKAGEPLRLPAVVTGRPQPEIKWTKDETDIDKERMMVETEGKNSILFIKKAVRADHGKFQIVGTNSSGTKMAETKVDVMGQWSWFIVDRPSVSLHPSKSLLLDTTFFLCPQMCLDQWLI